MAHVVFDHVSKTYSRQSRQFFWRFFLQACGRNRWERIHALRNVSFELRDGEALAVMGHNGAGKSTILNLAAGLTTPAEGSVDVSGRVAALLELGSGFHHDLTGAENLRLNAALFGLSKQQTARVFDEIVEFSELGDFIDEPLRTYSQGMILRLGFSVAVHVDPDILLIDELLAVGDKDFQQKCRNRIVEFKRAGKILLCVSHMPETLRQLCDTGLWIESGKVVMQGRAGEVINAYHSRAVAMDAGSGR